MPTQKVFKQRVRARMTKTGESYTTARHQLLRKSSQADEGFAAPRPDPETTATATTEPAPSLPITPEEVPADARGVSDESMVRATGRTHAEWFALLDAWDGTAHTHSEIARWLGETHGVPSWWRQSVTVAYERARGMRTRHQMTDGFSVGATKTVGVGTARALQGFTDPDLRRRWLHDGELRQRPTRAALTVRFDWAEPASRVVVTVTPKTTERVMVSVTHEQLPNAEIAEQTKLAWRARLVEYRRVIEG